MEEKSCGKTACGKSKDKVQNKTKTEKNGENFMQGFLLSLRYM
jgi:hypothetical protein